MDQFNVDGMLLDRDEKEKFDKWEDEFLEESKDMFPAFSPEERREHAIEFLRKKTDNQEYIEKALTYVNNYGMIQTLLEDDEIEEILINESKEPVYIYHRQLGKCATNIVFEHSEDIFRLIKKIKRYTGIQGDRKIIDVTLPEAIRVNITLPPISFRKPAITIRKFVETSLSIIDLVKNKTLNPDIAALLWICVDGFGLAPRNILISGGTSSGKTTLLNALLAFTR